jgi:hypothetical protein
MIVADIDLKIDAAKLERRKINGSQKSLAFDDLP